MGEGGYNPSLKFSVIKTLPSQKELVELDGGAEQERYDEKRTLFLQSKGHRVLRFWNNEIFNETEEVLIEILSSLNKDS